MNIKDFTQAEKGQVHHAIYVLLEQQGIKCEGIETEKDGNIRVINPSGKIDLNIEAVKQVISTLPQPETIEQLIERKIREMVNDAALKK